MASGARLWIVEQVIQAGAAYDRARLPNLLTLVLCGAQERTTDEDQALVEAAGFGRSRSTRPTRPSARHRGHPPLNVLGSMCGPSDTMTETSDDRVGSSFCVRVLCGLI